VQELQLLDAASRKRVLFCGEYIRDVYHYVSPLGRPTKDAILSVQVTSTEAFQGGVLAAMKHAEPFCAYAEHFTGGELIIKERYVEASHFHKLFQTYRSEVACTYCSMDDLPQYDAVIVIDYGHGMATPEFISALSEARYLAMNVQTNSGNYGYNLCTKYDYADYLCVDESEARLATQNRTGPIEESVTALSDHAAKLVITLGKAGAIGWSEQSGLVRCPAFTDSVVDTMGAGDAFFAITALVAEEADMESLLRIGNAAGALKSQIVGHRESISRDQLIKYLSQVR
jgi:hypothetical protein